MSEISPTSVILFDAAAAYANGTADTSIRSDLRIAFVAGAEWQWKRVGDDLAAKDAEIERLREALEPFADVALYILAEAPPEATMWQAFASCDGSVAQISLEYLRRARATLNPEASNV